jgi:hypothetical protein
MSGEVLVLVARDTKTLTLFARISSFNKRDRPDLENCIVMHWSYVQDVMEHRQGAWRKLEPGSWKR